MSTHEILYPSRILWHKIDCFYVSEGFPANTSKLIDAKTIMVILAILIHGLSLALHAEKKSLTVSLFLTNTWNAQEVRATRFDLFRNISRVVGVGRRTSVHILYINYLITESEVVTGKSQTETLPYWPSDSEVNTARPRFEIFP